MIIFVPSRKLRSLTGTLSEEDDYHAWLGRQRKLKENIRRVCKEYGQSLQVVGVYSLPKSLSFPRSGQRFYIILIFTLQWIVLRMVDYTPMLKVEVDSQQFLSWLMFDSYNKILFCRKENWMNMLSMNRANFFFMPKLFLNFLKNSFTSRGFIQMTDTLTVQWN